MKSGASSIFQRGGKGNIEEDADGRLSETADQPFQDGGQPYNATYTETFTYDKAGNTLATTATTYDGYGTVLSTQTTTNTWDLQGRLVGTQTPTGTVTDTYDALGRRTSQTVDGATTNYLNDPTLAYDQVLEEYAPNGVRLATYVRGLDLLFQDRSGAQSSYVHDGLGSTRALTGANGSVTDTDSYGPYGSLTGSTGSTVNPYLYAGQRQDATGGYVMESRTYDVSAARFTSRDSYDGYSDDPITLNHYVYTYDDPTDQTDPSGHDPIGDLMVSITVQAGMFAARHPALMAGFSYAFSIINVATLTFDPQARMEFIANAGNPAEVPQLLAADIRFLVQGGSAILRGLNTPRNVVTIAYRGGDIRDFRRKVGRLQEAARDFGLTVVTNTSTIRIKSAQDAYRRAVKARYTRFLSRAMPADQAAQVAKQRFKSIQSDHMIDLQVSGQIADPNHVSNLGMLNGSVNGSVGSQLDKQIRALNLRAGDVIDEVRVTGLPPGP